MTEQPKDGGAAFEAGLTPGHYSQEGMSLRDWFASQAPCPSAEWLSVMRNADQARNPYNEGHKPALRSTAMLVAQWKYEMADAMIAAREATQ